MQTNQEIKEQNISVGGILINYKIAGEGSVILILHGWGRGSDSWVEVQAKLAQAGHRVVAPDLPGFGKSELPQTVWGVDNYVDFVKTFAEKLNLDTFVLLGHSFGGQIAMKFALKHSGMLKGLILYAAAVIRRPPSLGARTIGAFSKGGNAVLSVWPLSFLKPLFKKLLYKILGNTDHLYEQGIMKQVREKVLREDLSPYFSKMQTHTLILWGENDTITHLKDARMMHKAIPGASLAIVPGANHRIHRDMPDEVSKNILQFAKKL